MIILLGGTATLFILFSLVACSYYYILFFIHLFTRKKLPIINQDDSITSRIVIIIPAHNESTSISLTIISCIGLSYPQDKYQIVVIADNCEDETADVARRSGVRVLERHDTLHKGKGHALSFAFDILLKEDFDAFLVLDADCILDENALAVLNASLAQGYPAVQLNNTVVNPDASPMTYALAIGNFIENIFFYSPKSQVGWAVLLRGTGMMLSREILTTLPWSAYSITEDVEYGIKLMQKGYRTAFVENCTVASPFPVDHLQLQIQRMRWAHGNLSFGRKEAVSLLLSGIRQRRWLLFDAGLTLLVLSKPLVLLCSVIAFLLASLYFFLGFFPYSLLLLMASITIGGLLFLYFFAGIYSMGITALTQVSELA